jgi:hypothetical protein
MKKFVTKIAALAGNMTFADDDSSKSGQQSFRDADLKRLKEHIANAEKSTDYAVPQVALPCGLSKALLARLEAAEAVIESLFAKGLGTEEDYRKGQDRLIKAWRKAAGK